ncbi:hypothetical protein HGRIS_014498 [Hohenbuehelia grisea]|uniref:Uncharacterized protein n=1 Tax=Hohenbuehelia grisea TaxID=104357 RepID=A0ABR3JTQ5_9AGAR
MPRPSPFRHYNPRDFDNDNIPYSLRPPTEYLSGLREGALGISSLGPVSQLPPVLRGRRGYNYQPPKMHFGWWFLFKDLEPILVAHDLVVRRTPNIYDAEEVFSGDDEDDDNEEDSASANLDCNTIATERKLSSFVRDVMGINSCKIRMPAIVSYKQQASLAIAMTHNYRRTGTELPPQEDIRKLQEFFGFQEEPCWSLDMMLGHWGIRSVSFRKVRKG